MNAEEYKEDGLILLDTFENSNITVDKARINPIIYGPFTVSHLMSQLGIIIGIILIKFRKKQELIKFKESDYFNRL